MRRREFISLIGAAATAWPLTARAQDPGRTYRIGFITPASRDSYGVLFDEMRLNGFIEGQNLVVVVAAFGIQTDQIPSAVASLVAASPDVIVGGPELPLRALQQATRTIPLIGMTEDMVGEGLVASLARPGGNITGVSLLSPELDGKRQEILIEAVPNIHKIAVLADSKVTQLSHLKVLEDAARGRGVEALVRGVAKRDEIIAAIKEVKAAGAQAINFLATPLFSLNNADVVAEVTTLRLPSIFQWPEDAEDGALIGYGPRFADTYRQRARMVAKVLRGTQPADIPVEQPTRFELVINLKTAKAINQGVPSSVLQLADKIIE
jgi:putative tryptophan/tyrosine transport system substrate-binding protein